jgi:hypothetical protein
VASAGSGKELSSAVREEDEEDGVGLATLIARWDEIRGAFR